MICKSRLEFPTALLVFFCLALVLPIHAQKNNKNFTKIQALNGIEEYQYGPNDMNILLVQDNSAPVVTVQIVYRVGSKHEVTGNTGSTHLLEHLNFKGTPTFNKKNGNAIFTMLQGIGARMNATTWNDRTNYYETIPSDQLELALHIEADRMRNSLLLEEDKASEMTVVRNEFERGESNPSRLLNKEIWATAYMAHPYHHSTIGWRSDIENMPIETLRNFYNTYYWPNNATLTIIGDFEKSNLFTLIDKYFSAIPKAPHDIPQPYTTEPEQHGPRRIVIKKQGQQGLVSIGYKIPGRMHDDLPALTVLGQILGSGTSSLINKTFIDTGIALYGFASPSQFQEVGLFSISLGFTPNKKHEALNTQLLDMIEKVKTEGVSQKDVDRIVSKLTAQTLLSRDGSGSIAGQLTEAIAGGDWTDYINGIERLKKVTASHVQQVAKTYLVENQSTTGYFIPTAPGGHDNASAEAQNVSQSLDSKNYFRTPDHSHDASCNHEYSEGFSYENYAETTSAYETIQPTKNKEKYARKEVSGIDIVSVKTGANDFLTVNASFPIGNYFNTQGHEVVPNLTTTLLTKGTQNLDKFAFSEKLEKLGVRLNIDADLHTVSMKFKCLTKDLPEVINLLADALRNPLFDQKEFDLIKERAIGNTKKNLTDLGTQGSIALSQAIYPKAHPNHTLSTEKTISDLEKVTLEDIKTFHKTYFGPAGMHLVAVGDVDNKTLYEAIDKAFNAWKGGIDTKVAFKAPTKVDALTKVISIPEKPSAYMYIGQYTGLERMDKDYLPFFLGTHILGGGFSARLMQTVRDNDGLTYGIYANHKGQTNTGGYWVVNATFNPSLFQKGLDATMVQIKKWVNDGVTADELASFKSNVTGSFKVGLATTSGLSGTLLHMIERGQDPSYIEQYPKDINAVTLEEVNASIKKYIDLDKLIVIKSGSLDQNSQPLKN
ncbi:insulinase family protein [Tamlana haliotis]|uniref:Insulinase family protein n=1 Tax=Pseudotamlana haliotis TaxID=2614804 RepID=A0A6N6MGC8_9FLAO|nr:pitrilysin family protein [Tamlana haliotis]KAB1067845.1 insulinase family protein [Tamlana haliotis]